MIRHIVTWKLTAGDAAAKAHAFNQLTEGFGALPAVIPEIKHLSLGRDLDETNGNWDVVLIVDFASTADLAVYQSHPQHNSVKQIVRSVTGDRSAIDFEL
jgi:hypothetical protein